MSIPSCAAMLRTSGLENVRSRSPSFAGALGVAGASLLPLSMLTTWATGWGAAAGAGAGAAAAGAESVAAGAAGASVAGAAAASAAGGVAAAESAAAGAAGVALAAGAAASPAPPISATTWLTGTVSPSWLRISVSTPLAGLGISASTLSVEISNSGWSRSTLSPTLTSHLVIVPSAIDSPIWGITTSVAMYLSVSFRSFNLEAKQVAHLGDQLVGVGQVELFHRRAIGYRGVRTAEPGDRRVEPGESALGDAGCHVARDGAGQLLLGEDQRLVRLAHGRQD